MSWLYSFLSMAALDVVFGLYTLTITRNQVHMASTWAGAIVLLNSTVIILYVDNHWLILPTAVGAVVGTYLAVFIDRRWSR